MTCNVGHRGVWMVVVLLTVLLMGACTSDDEIAEVEEQVQTVTTRLNFSLPSRIAGKRQAPKTRMSGDVVQADGTDEEFRGIDDIHMLCFKQYPQKNSTMLGSMISMNTTMQELADSSITKEDYSLTEEIEIPVSTSYFAFYARTADYPRTHEERMKYGIIETVGLSKTTYRGNSGIRFRPVPICNTTKQLGGSAIGQRLLNLLNAIAAISANDVAPNDKLSTADNLYLSEAWARLIELRVLSSQNVEIFLGYLNKLVTQEFPDDNGRQLAAAIVAKIAEYCVEAPAPDSDQLKLKPEYQGFPADLHLPNGAARIAWNATKSKFEPALQAYGKDLNVESVSNYVYPMNLQYQVFSDIVVSDTLVINEVTSEGDVTLPDTARFKNWGELISEGYKNAETSVQPTTQSVAMVQQVEYAVGRLALRARLEPGTYYYDARGQQVDVSNGFTLKGYIVGGQREVDYNFQPVEGSRTYAIYDTDLAEGTTSVTRRYFYDTDKYNYILGLGTPRDQNVCLALELVNNGPAAFQGADGVIAPGTTFYLVANMVPSKGGNYSSGQIDQIFIKDVATRVNLVIPGGYADTNGDGVPDPGLDDNHQPKPICGLATATYGLPDMQIPHPVVGVSVDLSWGQGLWFDGVEL